MTKTRFHAHIFLSFSASADCTRRDKTRRSSPGVKRVQSIALTLPFIRTIWDRDPSDRIITVCLNNYGFRNQTMRTSRFGWLLRETRSQRWQGSETMKSEKSWEDLRSQTALPRSLIDDFALRCVLWFLLVFKWFGSSEMQLELPASHFLPAWILFVFLFDGWLTWATEWVE